MIYQVNDIMGDWGVLYDSRDGKKIYEGHDVYGNALASLAIHGCGGIEFYEFTDEDEIDGKTPDNFNDIKGIKKL